MKFHMSHITIIKILHTTRSSGCSTPFLLAHAEGLGALWAPCYTPTYPCYGIHAAHPHSHAHTHTCMHAWICMHAHIHIMSFNAISLGVLQFQARVFYTAAKLLYCAVLY